MSDETPSNLFDLEVRIRGFVAFSFDYHEDYHGTTSAELAVYTLYIDTMGRACGNIFNRPNRETKISKHA